MDWFGKEGLKNKRLLVFMCCERDSWGGKARNASRIILISGHSPSTGPKRMRPRPILLHAGQPCACVNP